MAWPGISVVSRYKICIVTEAARLGWKVCRNTLGCIVIGKGHEAGLYRETAQDTAAWRAAQRAVTRRLRPRHGTGSVHDTAPCSCDTARVSATTRRWAGHDTATRASAWARLVRWLGQFGCFRHLTQFLKWFST